MRRKKHGNNLQRRFILRVLAPPFFILLILGIVIFWQLDKFVRTQAIDELRRASSTTAVKLEREFAIRQTVLRRTGEELFIIKSSYQTARQTLEDNRTACTDFVKKKKTFQGSTNGVCDPFLAEFAKKGSGSLQAIEDGYARTGQELIQVQNKSINDRLSAYKQFFPETLALLVVDDKQQLISSAQSAVLDSSIETLTTLTSQAQKEALEGKLVESGDVRLRLYLL